jgi:hypothetical protein
VLELWVEGRLGDEQEALYPERDYQDLAIIGGSSGRRLSNLIKLTIMSLALRM